MKIGNITPGLIYSKGDYIKNVYVDNQLIWSADSVLMGGIKYQNNIFTNSNSSWVLNGNNGTPVAAFVARSLSGDLNYGGIIWKKIVYNSFSLFHEATVNSISFSLKSSTAFSNIGSSPFLQMLQGSTSTSDGNVIVSGLTVGKKYKFQCVVSSIAPDDIGKKLQIQFIQGAKTISNSNIHQYGYMTQNYFVIQFTFICTNPIVAFRPINYNSNGTVRGTLFGALNILQDVV